MTDTPNPWHPHENAWAKQRFESENPPQFETLRDWHDHLSALTWSDYDKKPRRDDP
jgi:hypothetical protein